MKKEKDYHAKLVIYGLGEMKQEDFNKLMKWLEEIKDELLQDEKWDKTATFKMMK